MIWKPGWKTCNGYFKQAIQLRTKEASGKGGKRQAVVGLKKLTGIEMGLGGNS